jgi:transcription antitermination protein NusB
MTNYSDSFVFDPNSDNVVNRVALEHDMSMDLRSAARRIALQALYELDTSGHSVQQVIASHFVYDEIHDESLAIEIYLNRMASPEERHEVPRIASFISQLVMGVRARQDDIDYVLQKYAPDWPIDQVAVIDRTILRLALYELSVLTTPQNVAISQAIDLANQFGAEGTQRFVNGVLGALDDNVEEIRQYIVDQQQSAGRNASADA